MISWNRLLNCWSTEWTDLATLPKVKEWGKLMLAGVFDNNKTLRQMIESANAVFVRYIIPLDTPKGGGELARVSFRHAVHCGLYICIFAYKSKKSCVFCGLKLFALLHFSAVQCRRPNVNWVAWKFRNNLRCNISGDSWWRFVITWGFN